MRVFLIRGVIAIAWAAIFVAVSRSLTAGLTVGAGVLLVLYPLIDAVATLIDARRQHGSARRLRAAGGRVDREHAQLRRSSWLLSAAARSMICRPMVAAEP